MKIIGANLPWEPVKGSGYTKLDLWLKLTDELRFDVRRQKPNEQQPGNFAVYQNDVRISNLTHQRRDDAVAEAERHFYSLPQFSKSSSAVALNVMLENGKAAYRNGLSIYANPCQRSSVDHAQWAAGWLEASTAGLVQRIVDQFEGGAMASARAVDQMTHDLNVTSARLQAWNTVFEFADTLTEAKPGAEGEIRAWQFLTDFRSGDTALMSRNWPDWSDFLHKRGLGPSSADDDPLDDYSDAPLGDHLKPGTTENNPEDRAAFIPEVLDKPN